MTATARPSTYRNGDRIEYTGKTMLLHGALFYEFEFMEGTRVGTLGATQNAPASTTTEDR